jgi:hypothetical protein
MIENLNLLSGLFPKVNQAKGKLIYFEEKCPAGKGIEF